MSSRSLLKSRRFWLLTIPAFVDSPAAKRLKLTPTPTQHDSSDATACRGQPHLLPDPGSGPLTPSVENPSPSHLPSGVSKVLRARTFGVSPSPPLLLPLTKKFSWVSQPSFACRQPPSVLPFSFITSTGDSCTLTAATFPDALPLFLPDHIVRLTAAATHRNVRASPPSPHSPPSAFGSSPRSFAQANVCTPPRHVMARLEADRSLHADIQNKDQDAALARWRIDHHSDPLSPLSMRALFDLFPDEPSKGIEVLRSLQTGNMAPPLGHPPRVPGATRSSSQPIWSSLRQCPIPGSWTADEILSADEVDFQKPGLGLDYYARCPWPQTGPHELRHHQPLEHKVRSTCKVRIPTWYPTKSSPHALAQFVRLPPPTLLGFPVRGVASATLIRPSPLGPPLIGLTPFPHPHSPLRYPSRPSTQARSHPWHNLIQNSSRITPPSRSILITKSHDGAQLLRAHTHLPHFLRMAATLQMETCLATPDPFSFGYFWNQCCSSFSLWFVIGRHLFRLGSGVFRPRLWPVRRYSRFHVRGVSNQLGHMRGAHGRARCTVSHAHRIPLSYHFPWKLSTWFLIVSLALFVGLSCFFLKGPPGISLFSDPSAHACVADFTMTLEDIPHDRNGGMSALCRMPSRQAFGQEVQTLRSSTAISDSGVFARIFGLLGQAMTLPPGPGPRSSADPFSSVTPGFVFRFCNPVPVGSPGQDITSHFRSTNGWHEWIGSRSYLCRYAAFFQFLCPQPPRALDRSRVVLPPPVSSGQLVTFMGSPLTFSHCALDVAHSWLHLSAPVSSPRLVPSTALALPWCLLSPVFSPIAPPSLWIYGSTCLSPPSGDLV